MSKIIRTLILFALGSVALCLLLGEEQDADTTSFLARVIIDKALAAALIALVVRLNRRWFTNTQL